MDSATEDELLKFCFGGDTSDNEGRPRRMNREDSVLHDVAQYDVIHVTSGGQEVGLSRRKGDPPILYFLVISLFAMKLSEVVADFSDGPKLVALHDHVPHLCPDVNRIVVTIQKSCTVDLLVGPSPEKSCESPFGLRVAVVGDKNAAVCDRLGFRGTGGDFLDEFLGGAICTSDSGN